jgi:hypothetical protein
VGQRLPGAGDQWLPASAGDRWLSGMGDGGLLRRRRQRLPGVGDVGRQLPGVGDGGLLHGWRRAGGLEGSGEGGWVAVAATTQVGEQWQWW